MILTTEIILEDIAKYRRRIEAARGKLAALPEEYVPYPEYKKREAARRSLENEIQHVEKLIEIAREALHDECATA